MMDKKDLAEVTWEENVRLKEERAQNSALRKADINGQVRTDEDEPDKETGGMAREAGRELKVQHLLVACSVPGTMLSSLYVLSCLRLTFI